jgi:hypothetical protein
MRYFHEIVVEVCNRFFTEGPNRAGCLPKIGNAKLRQAGRKKKRGEA